MRIHELKTWPEPFGATWEGRKLFEVRADDRGFEVGDFLRLREWDPEVRVYSGRMLLVRVLHIERGPSWGLAEGLVVMSLQLRSWNTEVTGE